MPRPVPPEIDEFLAPFDDRVAELVHALRRRVLGVMPAAHEYVWDATNTVSLGYTPTPRWQDAICHVTAYTGHANLGFNEGASLPDPLGLLVGTGAHVRHVSFRTLEDTRAGWVADYLRAAMAAAAMTADQGDGGTTVRVSAGPKRRPGGTRSGGGR